MTLTEFISIPLLALAFTWLGWESHWLTIRLPVGHATIKILALPAAKPILCLPPARPALLLDTYHHSPSVFIPLDMPAFEGNITIVCKRCLSD